MIVMLVVGEMLVALWNFGEKSVGDGGWGGPGGEHHESVTFLAL